VCGLPPAPLCIRSTYEYDAWTRAEVPIAQYGYRQLEVPRAAA